MDKRLDQIREAAEADLSTFIRLVHPLTVLGGVHEEWIAWSTRSERKKHQLTLLPRDHQKSRLIAYKVAWHLTKYPWHRILYISSTSNLAEKQLKFIKDILTSKVYRRYWPKHVHPEENKREKWAATEISLDHPSRKTEGVRDPSIFVAGLTTSITGMHCDVAVLDDVVVFENALTNDGRNKVHSQYSLLSSIEGADAEEWVVGTRYHPLDLYNQLSEMTEEVFDEDGNIIDNLPVYEKFERQVEDRGDGTGEFLWPRQQRSDGRWFGFDQKILATKKAKYIDKTQFRAQYYNDPNNPEGGGINWEKFQYYKKEHLTQSGGHWYINDRRLNIFAAMDFAFSLRKKADHTALVVIGVDMDGLIYILDIERLKTERIVDYFEVILKMHSKWGFRKMRAETVSAQKAIVKELKNSYIVPNGLALSIDEYSPTRHEGTKLERLRAILEPRYDNLAVYHYRGGNCQLLEDELTQEYPPHDDIKDALAAAIDIAVVPTRGRLNRPKSNSNVIYHTRFGGVAH